MDFSKARKAADISLSEQGLDNLVKLDLSSAFPVEADRAKVSDLIAKVQAATDHNERVAAIKAVAATLTADGAAMLKKALLALLVIFTLGAGLVRAQEISEPSVKTFDFANPLDDPRGGFSWDSQGGRFSVAYVPIVYWQPGGVEYATLNWGMANDNEKGKQSMLISIGPRVDTAISWLAGRKWCQKNLRFLKFPNVQITADLATDDFFKHARPRFSLVTKFGGR